MGPPAGLAKELLSSVEFVRSGVLSHRAEMRALDSDGLAPLPFCGAVLFWPQPLRFREVFVTSRNACSRDVKFPVVADDDGPLRLVLLSDAKGSCGGCKFRCRHRQAQRRGIPWCQRLHWPALKCLAGAPQQETATAHNRASSIHHKGGSQEQQPDTRRSGSSSPWGLPWGRQGFQKSSKACNLMGVVEVSPQTDAVPKPKPIFEKMGLKKRLAW